MSGRGLPGGVDDNASLERAFEHVDQRRFFAEGSFL
jgi:hypothetical protein